MTEGDFSDSNTKMTVAEPEKVQDLWLESGDILIQRSNTPELVGTARMYQGPDRWAIFPDLLIRVRVQASVLRPSYAGWLLQSPLARRYFRQAAQGIAGSMPKISQTTIERFVVPVPPVAEQERIVAAIENHFSHLDAGVLALERARRNLGHMREAILSAAVASGQPRRLEQLLIEPLANGRSVPTAASGFPVLRLTALRQGRVDLSERKIGAWTQADAKAFLVQQGDFFIARGNGSLSLDPPLADF